MALSQPDIVRPSWTVCGADSDPTHPGQHYGRHDCRVKSVRPKVESSGKELHLLSSPGFARALIVRVGVIFLVVSAASSSRLVRGWLDYLYMWFQMEVVWGIMGLLSSACCALQLLLNAFSLGCAGFNTVLGPYRPSLMALTLSMQAGQWLLARGRFDMQRQAVIGTVITFPLMLLPEFLYIFSRVGKSSRRTNMDDKRSPSFGDEAKASTSQPMLSSSCGTSSSYEVRLRVEGMGCIACVTTVQNSLVPVGNENEEEKNGGEKNKNGPRDSMTVSDVSVDFESGSATYVLSRKKQNHGKEDDRSRAQKEAEAAAERITKNGFPAEVESVKRLQEEMGDSGIGEVASKHQAKGSSCCGEGASMKCGDVGSKNKEENSSSCSSSVGVEKRNDDSEESSLYSYLPLVGHLIAGLACSSCCILQLGLNILSGLILGPLRPILRAVTFAWLGGLWLFGRPKQQARRRLFFHTLFTIALAVLPEVLRLSTNYSLFAGSPSPPPPSSSLLEVTVDGMGCEACEVAVRSVFEQVSGVVAVEDVDFKTGKVNVRVKTEEWGSIEENELAHALDLEGYDLTSLHTRSNQK